jgi:hypothetical protein
MSLSLRKYLGMLRCTWIWMLLFLSFPTLAQEVKTPSTDQRDEVRLIPEEELPPQPKVIYGEDDRVDWYQIDSPTVRAWASATCALMSPTRLSNNGNGTYTVFTSPWRVNGLPACADEPFGNQPTAAFCTGFLVGNDLIATAGHCFDSSDLGVTYFVFGFVMLDANTPTTVVLESQVYRGVEIVARQYNSQYDYTLVRTDRPVTAPGATPLRIRRDGIIANGAPVGVIGYPAGLPLKAAFGSNTYVRDNSPDGYFVANTDTYGGNSGSPVLDPNTGRVEGILVRGENDYVISGSCFRSYRVSNTGGSGEEISKSTTFAAYVPSLLDSQGKITLDRAGYPCQGEARVRLEDSDLAALEEVIVHLYTDAGDSEFLTLTSTAEHIGMFEGNLLLRPEAPQENNGILSTAEGIAIYAVYEDADDGTGQPRTDIAQANVDCTPPTVEAVEVRHAGTTQALIRWEAAGSATSTVRYGETCGSTVSESNGVLLDGVYYAVLNGLTPGQTYYFSIAAQDIAGNQIMDDNDGSCYTFRTATNIDYLTKQYATDRDLSYYSIVLIPSDTASGYTACITPVTAFPTNPVGGTVLALGDDASLPIPLPTGLSLPFFNEQFSTVYVSSNGNLTFLGEDTSYVADLATHFNRPRLSALFADLNPSAGGTISYRILSDRLAITYQNVPEYPNNGSNSFQIELFYTGMLRITFLGTSTTGGITGLSRGLGYPLDYVASNWRAYPSCNTTDSDGDGLSDVDEMNIYHTDYNNPDTDGDGLPDGWEVQYNLNPLSSLDIHGAAGDPDFDNLTNAQEYALGTNPRAADSDGDGLPDGWEYRFDLNPLDASGENGGDGDVDGDGVTNAEEFSLGTHPRRADSDRDGVSDGQELLSGTDPTGAREPHAADINHDFRLSLSELLRVIQLYNSSVYHCAPGTEDGYAPGEGPTGCIEHSSDYQSPLFRIDITELLRTIQLYNAGGYRRNIFTEDTFEPLA